MKALLAWLDNRTGYRNLMHEALYERIPGGARWRYVWGSTLVYAFVVQLITGMFLWMAYSPSGQTAWESVYYIQYEMNFGWLLRGIHHFMAQAMVVLLALHLMQVVIDGAYRAPREFNFWLGLILMQIVLALSLTGYLLPWEQKGFWATRVATNLMSLVPFVGTDMQQVVVGGSDYGHHTLTRFFALHAGVLPAALVFFLVLHVAIFRRHGIHPKNPMRAPETTFWPDQVLRDAVACLAVLAVVLFFVFKPVLFGEAMPERPGDVLGAELGAPADPASQYAAARPEWYFLFLFQFLKLFHGDQEVYGAIVIPGILMGVLFLMPIVGRWKLGHVFNVLFLLCVLLGAGLLTAEAWYDDHVHEYAWNPPHWSAEKVKKQREESKAYLEAVEAAEKSTDRAIELARAPEGIPTTGAAGLLRSDPLVQGPALFKQYCATCHDHVDSTGHGIHAEKKTAPNLYGFASRAWLTGLLDPNRVDSKEYFGSTSHKEGDMVGFVKDSLGEFDKSEVQNVVIALSAEAALPDQKTADLDAAEKIAQGKKLIEKLTCTDCHKYYSKGELGSAPDLTGYGSRQWLTAFISNPAHKRFYADNNDGMPAFAENPTPERNVLNKESLSMIVRWLRGEWHRAP